jgi:hypothetical protein
MEAAAQKDPREAGHVSEDRVPGRTLHVHEGGVVEPRLVRSNAPQLVLIDQIRLRQRHRKLHASREQSPSRLTLELPNGVPQIPAHRRRG